MSFKAAVLMLCIVTAVLASLPGTFLVLRKRSMLIDAVSHAVFPGIIIGYWFTRDLNSPWLLVGAAIGGLIVIGGAEYLGRTGLITGDAPQGLIFPALFSLGVILITLNFAHLHLDTHSVLTGEPNLIAQDRLLVNGISIGPKYAYILLALIAVNIFAIALIYPGLKAATFDPEFAAVRGMPVRAIAVGFTFLTTLNVTAVFHAVGAVLVISVMIVPAACAAMFCKRLITMLVSSVAIAALGAILGFFVTLYTDAPTASGMAVVFGTIFALVFATSKLVTQIRKGALRRVQAAALAPAQS